MVAKKQHMYELYMTYKIDWELDLVSFGEVYKSSLCSSAPLRQTAVIRNSILASVPLFWAV